MAELEDRRVSVQRKNRDRENDSTTHTEKMIKKKRRKEEVTTCDVKSVNYLSMADDGSSLN